MEKISLLRFPVISFRKLESPYDEKGIKDYVLVVNIKSIPRELEEWRGVNVRDPKLNSGVSKKIAETLSDDPDSFFFKNRGLTIIADKVKFDNKNNVAEIEFVDKKLNGLLDGGHTFTVIRNFIDELSEDELLTVNACVKIEIIEGVKDKEAVVGIVEARNTSTQVKEQSISELLEKFQPLKDSLKDQSYFNRIAFKEYELLEDGSSKDIDIKELISYLICFDVKEFGEDNHPIKAYSSKSSSLTHFEKNYETMKSLSPLLPDIIKLRDIVYKELPDAYNKKGGKFGHLTGVVEVSNKKRMKKIKLQFTGKESSYRIPSGFIYPILSGLRNLIDCRDGKCFWITDPFKFFEEVKEDLAQRVGEQAKELRNPNKLGKDNATWRGCYDVVQLAVFKRKLK